MDPLSRNQRLVLELVRRHQPIGRSALTEPTNLTQQSVHRIVTQLEQMGLIRIGEEGATAGPGKPSPLLRLEGGAARSLGLLVNTDSIVLSVVDLTCALVAERRIPLELGSRVAALPVIRAEAVALLGSCGLGLGDLCGLGFTMPGYFVNGMRAFNAPEPLRDWSLIDLAPELGATFGLQVFVENSATAGAIGESLSGVGPGLSSFAYLSFDYGFGGGIILNGAPLAGYHGNAGELSNIYMTQAEQANRPALNGLVRALRAEGIPLRGVEDLRQTFDPGWPGVAEWIDRIMPQLDRIVVTLHGLVDPEAIVFGGQIPRALAEMLIARVRFPDDSRYGIGMPLPRLLLGEARGEPAATGAALMPLKHRFFT